MTTFDVLRGEFPFNEIIGYVYAPADQPEVALREAIKLCNVPKAHPDIFMRHPVVQPSAYTPPGILQ
jgi:hypothetical protein